MPVPVIVVAAAAGRAQRLHRPRLRPKAGAAREEDAASRLSATFGPVTVCLPAPARMRPADLLRIGGLNSLRRPAEQGDPTQSHGHPSGRLRRERHPGKGPGPALVLNRYYRPTGPLDVHDAVRQAGGEPWPLTL